METVLLANFIAPCRLSLTFPVLTVGIGDVLPVLVTSIPVIFHLSVSIVRAPGAITVTSIIVSIATVIFSRRVIPTATSASWGWRTTATARGPLPPTPWTTVTSGVEPPRCRRGGTCPLCASEYYTYIVRHGGRTSIFSISSLPIRLLCIS